MEVKKSSREAHQRLARRRQKNGPHQKLGSDPQRGTRSRATGLSFLFYKMLVLLQQR